MTLGDTIDQLHPVDEIRACQDCLACYTAGDGTIRCNAENGPGILANGNLRYRHPDCPMAGKTNRWPRALTATTP